MAFVLAPAAPITDWLAELDKWTKNSPDFFVGRPIVLDLAALTLTEAGIVDLIAILGERGIRVMGLEGIEPEQVGPSLPPVLKGGRPAGDAAAEPASRPASSEAAAPAPPPRAEPSTLLVEDPIRSGQSVVFPYGDVVVLGAVSSGAEVVAGGSIHIYGALRGRAMAGSMGNARSRIF